MTFTLKPRTRLLSLPLRRTCGRLLFFALLAAPGAAQTPPEPSIFFSASKQSTVRQTSPTAVEDLGCLLTINVIFAATAAPNVFSLELRGANLSLELIRETPTRFIYVRPLNDVAALERALPDGNYTLIAGSTSVPVAVTTNPAILDARVSNYDALQRWNGTDGLTAIATPTTATASTQVGFYLNQENSSFGFSETTLTSPSTAVSVLGRLPGSVPGEAVPSQLRFSDNRTSATATAQVTLARRHMIFFNVARAHLPPAITGQPTAQQTVNAGATVTLSVAATGNGLTYVWRKNLVPITGATNATLSLTSAQPGDSGVYSVIVSNTGGVVLSSDARVTIIQPTVLPVIATAPAGKTVAPGEAHTLSVTATGTLPLSYQWFRDGSVIAGATSSSLSFDPARLADGGSYTVSVTNAAGSVTSIPVELLVVPVSRISNLSIRSLIGGDAGALTVGITIGGAGTSGPKPLLLRAVGPTLALFGVGGALPDPQITLLSGTTVITANDDWSGSDQVSSTSAAVGAFALASDASKDAALARSTEAGGYTIRIAGAGTSSGVALAEVYDATATGVFFASTPRLTNVSALTRVGTGGDILIAGFSIAGSAAKTVLVRGIGPTLGAFGVGNALADPRLELFASGATQATAANDNWSAAANAAQVASVSAAVGAFPLPGETRDAALLVTLAPGNYTVHVSGVGNTAGNALVEVYEVP